MNNNSKILIGTLLFFSMPVHFAFGHQKSFKMNFDELDYDSNGFVTIMETNQIHAEKFKTMDKDSDGFLTVNELQNNKKNSFDKRNKKKMKGKRKNLTAFLKRHDKNGDSMLSLKEFPNKWTKLLKLVDSDEDNKVTKEEYLKFIERK